MGIEPTLAAWKADALTITRRPPEVMEWAMGIEPTSATEHSRLRGKISHSRMSPLYRINLGMSTTIFQTGIPTCAGRAVPLSTPFRACFLRLFAPY